jgi:alkylation response protein AidB-like acyl-CoA dehydrogenase
LRHEASRLLIYKTAILSDLDRDVTMAAALAKLQTSETAVGSVIDVLQVFGAEGYTQSAGIGVELLDSVGGLSYSGTSDIQRNIVASLLGVDRPARQKRRAP